MSTIKANNHQIGSSSTPSDNFTLYQPASPDGTVRRGVGNAGATTSDAITVTNSGNVGIGTTSPGYKLDIQSTSNPAVFLVNTTSGLNCFIGTSGSGVAQIGSTNQGLRFLANNAEAMRLDSSGNLLVGATSAYISGAGNAPIQIVASGTGGPLALRNSGATAGKYWRIGPDATANSLVVYNQSNVGVFISDGGTSWNSSSDERLKTDLAPIVDAIKKITTIRAVTGRFKTDDENKSRAFLIAQDVQQVLPEAVSENDEGYLGIAYTDTIPLLVAAIKELSAKNSELECRLTALEGKA